jgi:hypothetical protein
MPREDDKSPVVLAYAPAESAVTSTDTAQELPEATVPPEREMTPEPDAAVIVPPEQVVEAFAGNATVIPAGRLSAKARPVAARRLAVLPIVNVSVLMPPLVIEPGLKDFARVGGGAPVVFNCAVAVPLEPADEVRAPDMFTLTPVTLLVMSTERVHELPAATVPPL